MSTERAFRGIWIPAELWQNKNLSIQEKVMLIEIDSLSSDPARGCYKKNQAFSEFFGLSKNRVSEIIKSLETKGFIRINYQRKGQEIVERNIFVIAPFGKPDTPSEKLENPFGKVGEPPSEKLEESNTIMSNTVEGIYKQTNEIVVGSNHVGKSATVKKQKLTANDLFNEFKNNWPLIAQCDDEILHAWCKVRIDKKAEHTELAHKAIEHELSILAYHGLTVTQAIREAAANGWKGLKASWYDVVKYAGNAKPVDNYRTADAAIKRLNDTSWAE